MKKTSLENPKNLFVLTFIAIISIYLYLFGKNETIQIIENEYLSILTLFVTFIAFIYFKIKLKNYEVINFLPNNNISLKSTILFFLFFQIIDYISEDGFTGMVKQWFLYWILGIIALLLMQIINYYKNYRLIKN